MTSLTLQGRRSNAIAIISIAFANMNTYIDPQKLSECQKQKIALARALVHEPDVNITVNIIVREVNRISDSVRLLTLRFYFVWILTCYF